MNWFNKNFPDDSGYPIFLFEWTFILFKCNKLQEAEEKTYDTYFSNTYLLDKFLGKEPQRIPKREYSNLEFESLVDNLQYSCKKEEFIEFSNWLATVISSSAFRNKATAFLASRS